MILSQKRNYLRINDIKGGEIVEILNEGEWIESKRYTYNDGTPRKDFYIKIKINEEERDLRLNVTNRGILISAYGNDTAKWIGKSIVLKKIQAMTPQGLRDAIIVEPTKEEEPAL